MVMVMTLPRRTKSTIVHYRVSRSDISCKLRSKLLGDGHEVSSPVRVKLYRGIVEYKNVRMKLKIG